MTNDRIIYNLNITMAIIARQYLPSSNYIENALRRMRNLINSYKGDDIDKFDKLKSDIDLYTDYSNCKEKLIALISLFKTYYELTGKLKNSGFNNNDELLSHLSEVILIDKLLIDRNDELLNADNRYLNTNLDLIHNYNLYEATLVTLLCVYSDRNNLNGLESISNALINFINNDNDEELLSKRKDAFTYFKGNIKKYPLIKEGWLSEENIKIINKLFFRLSRNDVDYFYNKNNDDELVSKEWLDYVLTNHSGYDDIRNRLTFIINMLNYNLNYNLTYLK